jgi:hypothetical protein
MHIIGLTGFAGSGKDLTYQLLSERRPGVVRAAFADALRAEVAIAFGCHLEVLADPATKEIRTRSLAAYNCTDVGFVRHLGMLAQMPELKPRTVMQQCGDYRLALHPDYFIRLIEPVVAGARAAGAHALVITDVRLFHELDWLLSLGGVLWRVTRPGVIGRSGHATEWALNDREADLELRNDGDLESLAAQVTGAFDDLVQRRAAA